MLGNNLVLSGLIYTESLFDSYNLWKVLVKWLSLSKDIYIT
jgi:hypothetical protein